MSWFGNVLKFEGFNGKEMLKQIKHNPLRLFYGSADPFSTKMWNGILGTHDKPIIDQMGGATGDRYRDAEAAGIDSSAGKGVQNVAHAVAGAIAGGYGLQAAGGLGGAGAGAGGAEAGGIGAGGLEGAGIGSGATAGGGGAGSLGTGWGIGGDALSSGAAGDFGIGSLAGEGSGAYGMSSAGTGLFGGGAAGGAGGGATAGGSTSSNLDWGSMFNNLSKNAQSGGGGNDAAIRRQEALAEQLRRDWEMQQAQSQLLPGIVNMKG